LYPLGVLLLLELMVVVLLKEFMVTPSNVLLEGV